MTNKTVSLTLQIKGQQANQELKRIAADQLNAVRKINSEQQKLAPLQANQINTAKKFSDELRKQSQAFTAQKRDAMAVEAARKLGVRTEQQIHHEIKQTRNTYAQLSILQRQGVVTAKDMQRAYAAMSTKVNQLNRELGKTVQAEKQIQQIQRQGGGSGMGVIQRGSAIAGAAAGGGMVLSTALQNPRDYDSQLTYITATATGGQGLSTSERLKSKETLNNYIKTAVRGGGGTREDAAEAANALIASGKYDLTNVSPALNAAVKTAFSAGADAKDAATLTVRMQDFGMTDLQKGHDIAVRGAQLGSFEYKDQAKWLAQQMAAAKAAGYSGEKGFIELVAMNQVAMSTAATTDEGGNNLVNLLTKLSSTDFSNSVAKAVENTDGLPTKTIKNKKGKIVGQEFDWATYSMAEREKGVYGVDAFVKLIERQMAGNSQYQNLQKKIANATDDQEKKSILEDMSNIASGSQLGEFLADRQALMSALAMYYKKDELSEIKGVLPSAGGTVSGEYDMVSQAEFAKDQALEQEKLFAQSGAYDAVSQSLGDAKTKIVEWARGNEDLAKAGYGAAVAMTAVAVGAAGAAIALKSMGGNSILPDAGGKKGGKISNSLKKAGAAFVGYEAGYALGSEINERLVEGTAFGDLLGEGIAKTFALFGHEESKAAVETQKKYEQMIAEQQTNNQYSKELIGNIKTLISVTQQNKPLPFSGGSLLEGISNSAAAEEKRHGAFIPFALK